jgi:hypothetical protein
VERQHTPLPVTVGEHEHGFDLGSVRIFYYGAVTRFGYQVVSLARSRS